VLWRIWSVLSGLPIGVLVGLVWLPQADPSQLAWTALAGGAVLGILTSLLARWHDDVPDRPSHLATAASAAWLALPAAATVELGLAPGPGAVVLLVGVVLALSLARGTSSIGAAGGALRWVGWAGGAVLLGGLGFVALGAALAQPGSGTPAPPSRWAETVYDLDARVATQPLPDCEPRAAATRVLLARGAHPALSSDGAVLWFDAAVEGRRQIHRLERATGRVACWTCREPGNNLRPAHGGGRVVFETDRNADWRHPDDTDIHVIRDRAGPRPPVSRRLTFSSEADSHPLVAERSGILVWSRRSGGRYEVVAASILNGHGGTLLGTVGVLASGGAAWIAPLAWSPDARSLVIARGNPFAPLRAVTLDPATGAQVPLGDDAVAASFDADGGWMALATAHPGHAAGALPAFLGFLLGPFAEARSGREPIRAGTAVWSGASPGPGTSVSLDPELESWGEPTGIALDPGGTGFVIGQRRRVSGQVEERLVEVRLACGGASWAAGGHGP
jgi:hypothetical protein